MKPDDEPEIDRGLDCRTDGPRVARHVDDGIAMAGAPYLVGDLALQ